MVQLMKEGALKWWRRDGKIVLIIVLFYGILQLLGITCPIKFMTGISCAGCGMTRAWLAALRLDFESAFAYHPLFFLAVPLLILYIWWNKLPALVRNSAITLIVAAMVICYIIRMLDPADSIVVCDIENGLLSKVSSFLILKL